MYEIENTQIWHKLTEIWFRPVEKKLTVDSILSLTCPRSLYYYTVLNYVVNE